MYHHNNLRRGGRRFNGQPEDESSATEKPNTKILPSLSPRGDEFRQELSSQIIPWQEITVSLDNFPYYIEELSQSLLVECVASNLKPNKLRKYVSGLKSSSRRILLQTIPGQLFSTPSVPIARSRFPFWSVPIARSHSKNGMSTELYRERLVSAIAREMKVPLLKLDEDHGCYHVEHNNNGEDSADESESDEDNHNKVVTLKKGDRVQYVGRNITFEEVNNRTLSHSQRGEVYEVKGNTVAVVFNIAGLKAAKKAEKDEKNTDILRQAIAIWLHANDIVPDAEVGIHDFYIAMEVLYEVLESQQPMIVYFSDSFLWPPASNLNYYKNKPSPSKVKKIFKQLPEGVVMICAENNWEPVLQRGRTRFGTKEEFPEPLTKFIERIPRGNYVKSELHKLFSNVVCIESPMDEDLVETFVKQIEEDRLTGISARNLKTMHQVLEYYNLSCTNLEHAIIQDRMLTREKVEKIVSWALNHYFSSCPVPCVNEEELHVPLDSIKLAISRLKMVEDRPSRPKKKPEKQPEEQPEEQPKGVQDLASGSDEEFLVSSVYIPEDIYVKLDDFGAPENLKKVLYETVVLPMRRPELFSHGNLLKEPYRGILLFGPPGTGKTLVVDALAKESGANLINISVATFTSMCPWALFSYANKLAPVVIYLDQVDNMLGARGHNQHEKSKMNEFLAAWDSLDLEEESRRIIVIGATNRPFDLDEAVIHRMPRRIYLGLPDLESRSKILKLILNKESLESGFSFEQLAEATEGYSGSDLRNLCVAAAKRPIEEFVEQESKGETSDGVPALRPLNLDDFIDSKAKVRASVAPNASSSIMMREWKELYGEAESQRQQI